MGNNIKLRIIILLLFASCAKPMTLQNVKMIKDDNIAQEAKQLKTYNDIIGCSFLGCIKMEGKKMYHICSDKTGVNNPDRKVYIECNQFLFILDTACDSLTYTNEHRLFYSVGYYGKYQKEGTWITNRLAKGKENGGVYLSSVETYRHGNLNGWVVDFDSTGRKINQSYFLRGTGYQKIYNTKTGKIKEHGWLWRGQRVGKWRKL